MSLRPLLCLLAFALAASAAEPVRFPADAGVRSVKDFGALGDGAHDDTAAINKALESTGMLCFPAGTYLVTDQLKPPPRTGGAPSRRILQGESRDASIIRLADRTPGFGDAKAPKQVLRISWDIAQAFRNSVRDLTVDVGAGNAGATAVGFFASNQGSMQRVTVRAGAGSGAVGVDLALGDNGPLTIADIRISGFALGIRAKYGAGFTCDGIEMDGIRELGVRSEHTLLFMRRVRFAGACPFLIDAANSHTVLFDADLTATGAQALAIRQAGRILLRDVVQHGYGALVGNGTAQLAEARVGEWHSHPTVSAFPDSTQCTLRLPVVERPVIPWSGPDDWASVASYPPAQVDGKPDWGPAVQAAIDSGKGTVYFPLGFGDGYPILTEVVVRGAVRRIIGLEQQIAKGCRPLFTIADGAGPVVIEHFDSIYSGLRIRQTGKRPVLLQCMSFGTVEKAAGSGDLFLFDTYVQTLRQQGGNLWSIGLNSEYSQANSPDGVHVINDGGRFWMFGFKNEGDGTKVATVNGGASELYAYVLSNKATPSDQKPVLFTIKDSRASINLSEGVLRKQPSGNLVDEERGGDLRRIRMGDVPRIGNQGSALILFGGAPRVPGERPPLVGYPASGP